MIVQELNPNHSVTRALHDKWPIICAILMRKFGKGRAVITLEDLQEFAASNQAIVARGNVNDIELFLVGRDEGAQMARKEGGLPA